MPDKDDAYIYQEILNQKVTNPHRAKKKNEKDKEIEDMKN